MGANHTDIPEALACPNDNVAVALGAFSLIHAGTVAFLEVARQGHERLVAAILPGDNREDTAQADQLLRPEERVRILAMLESVDGVALVEKPEDLAAWHAAAPDAVWLRDGAEDDIAPESREAIAALGITVEALPPREVCTTADLLERIAR